jgi:quercetin dioxygenase-like cupin family protein
VAEREIMPSMPQIIAGDANPPRDFLGFAMDWKVTGEHTGGVFSIVEASAAKGAGPPLHYHESADEFFYVVDGTMTFKVGDDLKTIRNGGFVWIPRTVVHSFMILSDTARFLFGYVPAGVEQMFLEAVPPGSNRERFGTIIVGPPLGDGLRGESTTM